MTDDIPSSVRIRTDDGNAYRFDAIEDAAEFYECNRSDAVARACHDIPALVEAVESVLGRDDLTEQQAHEIAQRFDRAARAVEFSVSRSVEIERDK